MPALTITPADPKVPDMSRTDLPTQLIDNLHTVTDPAAQLRAAVELAHRAETNAAHAWDEAVQYGYLLHETAGVGWAQIADLLGITAKAYETVRANTPIRAADLPRRGNPGKAVAARAADHANWTQVITAARQVADTAAARLTAHVAAGLDARVEAIAAIPDPRTRFGQAVAVSSAWYRMTRQVAHAATQLQDEGTSASTVGAWLGVSSKVAWTLARNTRKAAAAQAAAALRAQAGGAVPDPAAVAAAAGRFLDRFEAPDSAEHALRYAAAAKAAYLRPGPGVMPVAAVLRAGQVANTAADELARLDVLPWVPDALAAAHPAPPSGSGGGTIVDQWARIAATAEDVGQRLARIKEEYDRRRLLCAFALHAHQGVKFELIVGTNSTGKYVGPPMIGINWPRTFERQAKVPQALPYIPSAEADLRLARAVVDACEEYAREARRLRNTALWALADQGMTAYAIAPVVGNMSRQLIEEVFDNPANRPQAA